MKIYGYEKDGVDLLELKEASILCKVEEIQKIIDFLQNVKKELEDARETTEMYHSHYRDWDKEWEKGAPDLIVVTED